MDGVLVDSEPLHMAKLHAVSARHGIALQESDFAQHHDFQIPDGKGTMKRVTMPLNGAGDKNIYYWALAQRPELAAELSQGQWLNELLGYYVANKTMLRPRRHMVRLVRALDQQGAVQAVVTSGIPAQVQANLSVLGKAKRHFAFTLTAEDVKQSKPSPEAYLTGQTRARQMPALRHVPKRNLVFVAVEDSQPGVTSALTSKISCLQYLLPGHQAMPVRQLDRKHFKAARHGLMVEPTLQRLIARARPRPTFRLASPSQQAAPL